MAEGEEGGSNPTDVSLVETNRKPKRVHQIRRLEWITFENSAWVEEDEVCTINVLIGEPIVATTNDSWYGFSSGRMRKAPEAGTQSSPGPAGFGKGPLPERIRIQSPLLRSFLTKLLEVTGKKRDFRVLHSSSFQVA
jgi:hypothetical protein